MVIMFALLAIYIAFVIIYLLLGRSKDKQISDANVDTTADVTEPVKVYFSVKGTSYRDDDAIHKAQSLNEGSSLQLDREWGNEHDSYAIKVMKDNVCIGYVDRKYSMAFSQNLNYLKSCVVDHLSSHDIPFIDAIATFDGNADIDSYVDTNRVTHVAPGISARIIMPGDREREDNPELEEALRMRYKDPKSAVEIFLRVMNKEEGFFSAHEALKCYRDMGEYQKEKELILRILDKCKDMGDDDYTEVYQSRLHSVEYFIAKEERKKDLEKAKIYLKEKKYEDALRIYEQYFDKDNVVINVADGLRKCYNKLGDKAKEEYILDLILSQDLADTTRAKYQKYLDRIDD